MVDLLNTFKYAKGLKMPNNVFAHVYCLINTFTIYDILIRQKSDQLFEALEKYDMIIIIVFTQL